VKETIYELYRHESPKWDRTGQVAPQNQHIAAHEDINPEKEILGIGSRRSAANPPQNPLLAIHAIQSAHPDKATPPAGTRFSGSAQRACAWPVAPGEPVAKLCASPPI